MNRFRTCLDYEALVADADISKLRKLILLPDQDVENAALHSSEIQEILGQHSGCHLFETLVSFYGDE